MKKKKINMFKFLFLYNFVCRIKGFAQKLSYIFSPLIVIETSLCYTCVARVIK